MIRESNGYRLYKLIGKKSVNRAMRLLNGYYKYKKVKYNKVLFMTHKGKSLYSGNMKFIAQEILKQNLHCQICWYIKSTTAKRLKDTKKNNYGFPKQIKVVTSKAGLLKSAYTANVIVTDNHFPKVLLKFFKKKPNQLVINTWHGSLGIKKIGMEGHGFNKTTKKKFSKLLNLIDAMISNCEWESNVYRGSIGFSGEIQKLGHPRNDIFFLSKDENARIKRKIYENLQIPADSYLILIAPTYRCRGTDEEYKKTLDYDFDNIKNAFKKRFNKTPIIALRLHPELKKQRVADCFKEGIIDATSYPDIQELLVASDAMITDYSSCIFDFLFTRKPGFIFAPDRKYYEMARGLYFPLEESPFPVAEDNETLCKNIVNFDNDFYQKRVEEFLKSRNVVDDGHASERLVELIKEHLK